MLLRHRRPNKQTTQHNLQPISKSNLKNKTFQLSGNQYGMGVIERMVGLCIIAILASVAIPFYINYVQQARVVAVVIPRLQLVESNISYFYATKNRLPGSPDAADILADIDMANLKIVLAYGPVTMTIKANDEKSRLDILDGKILVASPVLTKDRIITWHLSGELADRLKINH